MTKHDKEDSKKNFFDLVSRFNAYEHCCSCHPHGEWDECDYSPTAKPPCKRSCAHMKLQKIVLMLMWEYVKMSYFVPITKGPKRKRQR